MVDNEKKHFGRFYITKTPVSLRLKRNNIFHSREVAVADQIMRLLLNRNLLRGLSIRVITIKWFVCYLTNIPLDYKKKKQRRISYKILIFHLPFVGFRKGDSISLNWIKLSLTFTWSEPRMYCWKISRNEVNYKLAHQLMLGHTAL